MPTKEEIIEWLAFVPAGASIGVDEGGLSLVVVPEPTSLAAVAAGAGIVAMVLRRRSRR